MCHKADRKIRYINFFAYLSVQLRAHQPTADEELTPVDNA